MAQNNKKALVTGGAGFIGSHLVEALVARGYQVTVLDDLSSGKLANIEAVRPAIEFKKGSVADFRLLREILSGVDYVFHLAAIASVPKSIDDPIASHDVNATGTLNVLLAARQNKVKKVIFASSAAVYGDVATLPVTEETVPHPLSPYAANKLAADYYCQVFSHVYQLPTTCLRCFNVYGPRQDPKSQYATVIPAFISTVKDGKPPVIFDDGEQTRDFIFVKDVVAAYLWAAETGMSGVFNISHGEGITINRLAELVIKLSGKKMKPVYREARAGDIKYSFADISKARAAGYQPKYSLEAGLAETLKWFNNPR